MSMTDEERGTLLIVVWCVAFAFVVIGVGAWMITR